MCLEHGTETETQRAASFSKTRRTPESATRFSPDCGSPLVISTLKMKFIIAFTLMADIVNLYTWAAVYSRLFHPTTDAGRGCLFHLKGAVARPGLSNSACGTSSPHAPLQRLRRFQKRPHDTSRELCGLLGMPTVCV